jgi:hypothetical protein
LHWQHDTVRSPAGKPVDTGRSGWLKIRLLIRWEKKAENWLALIHLANALIAFRACYW